MFFDEQFFKQVTLIESALQFYIVEFIAILIDFEIKRLYYGWWRERDWYITSLAAGKCDRVLEMNPTR